MLKKRLIPVLIVRDGRVVQSVKFKHTNVIHYDAIHAVECFNRWAVDEIIILNVSKSSDSTEEFLSVVEHISKECFVPLSVGGWITDIEYARKLLKVGADKLVVNTALKNDPELVTALSGNFGRQCIIASMDIKKMDGNTTKVMVDRGSENTDIEPIKWAQRAESLGAGEILLNSIDHDGFRKGYNLEWIEKIAAAVTIPVIAMGGVFTWDHFTAGCHVGASAVAAANIFHYTEQSTKRAKDSLRRAGIAVRK